MTGMARHLRGMGPLFRRGTTKTEGNWWFSLDSRKIRTPYTDKRAAEAWRRKYLAEQAQGNRAVGAENATIADLLGLVEDDYERTGKASQAAVESRLKRLRERLGTVRLSTVRDDLITGYADDMRREGRVLKSGKTKPYAPATINRDLEILRRAFYLGARQSPPLTTHVPRFPMADESGNVRTQTIDRPTYERLCEALPDAERWLCVLAYHTGWRLGKLLSLTWAQVDWDEMVLRAPAHQRESKRVGTAPIYGDMQTVLREALVGGAATVIHRPDGSPVVDIRKAWARGTRAAGCPGLRFHDLRACAASNLADVGIPEGDIMRILGHKTRAMFDRYRIVSNGRLREIGRMMEARTASQREGRSVQ